jgi:TatD DNase family protein
MLIDEHRDIVVAVGETGLDRHYLSEDSAQRAKEISEQYYWFERLARVGKDYSLPLVIHSRDARQETIDAIKKFEIRSAVIHCFSENYGFAKELMEYSDGIFFSFSGILTYPNAPEIRDAASKIPLDRILVETDAPFLSPQAVR